MSKAVANTGADPTEFNEHGEPVGEWEGDADVTDATVAAGVTGIKDRAFLGCKGLTNLSFLKGSAITTVGEGAFGQSSVTSLQGMEGVMEVGMGAFYCCKDLRTIEGLGCEEMGVACFARCPLLQSMKGWPASMTVIPGACFFRCTGMATVDCNLSHVTSIGVDWEGDHSFAGCTSLLPPSLSAGDADPAAVLAFLKRKSKDERTTARYAIYASALRARSEENLPRTAESPTPLAFSIAKLPPDMARVVVEFAHGVVKKQGGNR
jgi:hypothetical protein